MNAPRFLTQLLGLSLILTTGLWNVLASPGEDMADAAGRFLAALTTDQKAKATFPLQDDERFNWHFIPKTRNGLQVKEMTPEQRPLALGLLNSAMSQRGFLKATTIMSLEQILHELEQGRGRFARDPELYHFSVFGTPGRNNTWAWRVEGHHLSLNFTIVKGTMTSVTPSFFGTNPAEVRTGPRKGLRVLGAEEDWARLLVQSLNDEQKKIAIVAEDAPNDIITVADRRARVLEPKGLALSGMSEPQATLLWGIIREYIGRARQELAAEELEKIEQSGKNAIFFAWAGYVKSGERHYYRVQGPTFLLEYDNTQNDANHVHAVWRDLQNDFGEDLLKKHYSEAH